jgi:glycosidase
MLGEVNLPYEEQKEYFGDNGDELTMLFDFVGMQQMYLSLARQDARPLASALESRPDVHPDSQWAAFVRNHDELTLDKLLDSERQEVFDVGMGEDLSAEGRMAVRTPMQWMDDVAGGFSTAEPADLVAPPVDGQFGPQRVNVVQQRRDPDSLLSFMRKLIRRYRERPELGWGRFEILPQPNTSILLHKCTWEDSLVVMAHNFGPRATGVTVDLTDDGGEPCVSRVIDLLDDFDRRVDGQKNLQADLEPYGFRWLRLQKNGDNRLW